MARKFFEHFLNGTKSSGACAAGRKPLGVGLSLALLILLAANGDAIPDLAVAASGKNERGPVAEYSARPDPRDCALPDCGGYFLYEINETIRAGNQDFCTADLPVAAYVVRCMCPLENGTLVEFYPSCNKPLFGDIEPDPDYKQYNMLVSPSCEQ